MIAITHLTTGETLQLEAGQTLTIEQAAGWLADEELPGAFSYPISFPLNDANRRFLQYGYRPDAARPDMNIPVSAKLEGVLYRRCTLSYRISDNKGDGYLKIDSGEVYDSLKRLTLRQALTDVVNLGAGGQTLDQRMTSIARMPVGSFPLAFFPIRNELFFEENMSDLIAYTRQPYVNCWTRTGFKVDTSTVHGYMVAPQFFLTWVYQQLFQKIGYRVQGDWLGNPEVQRLTILNQTALPPTPTIFTSLYGYDVTAGNHLPDMTVSDFLKAIRQRFGLIYTFNANEKTASIRRFIDVVRQARPQNLSAYQLAKYGIDPPDGAGFSVTDYVDEADELYKNKVTGEIIKPAPLVIGRGGTAIDLKCGTTQLIYEASPLGGSSARWFVPTVRQPGNVLPDPYYAKSDRSPDKDGKQKYNVGLRLLSYRGMTTDSAGNEHPLGSPDVRDGRQTVVGAESAALTGPRGIWASGLRQYYYFRDQTRRVTEDLLLPIPQVGSLKLDETVQLKLEGHSLTSFLPDKLTAEAPQGSGLVHTQLELLTLPAGLDQPREVVDPLVWVELIQVTGTQTLRSETVSGVLTEYRERKATLTLKAWKDQQRSAPVNPANLRVNVRRLKYTFTFSSGIFDVNYAVKDSEPIDTYTITSSVTTLDASAYVYYRRVTRDRLLEEYGQYFMLDPGEGYNIL